jgi:hypothetical protein
MSKAARKFLIQKARQDSYVAAALTLRDEVTGGPVDQGVPAHRAMHRLWSSGDRSVAWSAPEMGKSQNLVARMAWEIGHNPGLRCALLSGTEAQAQSLLRALVITLQSQAYQEIFPGLRIDRSTAGEFTIAPRPATLKDPTCWAAAVDQSSNLGKRVDLAGLDDIVDLESTRSAASLDRKYSDILTVTSSRIAPAGRVMVVGTAFHPEDALHRLARLPGWRSQKFPVLNPDGTSAWPQRWPLARIEQRRLELGPLRFLAAMQCEATSDAALCFRAEDLERALSNGVAAVHSEIPQGRVVIGVDPAWSSKPGADESGIVMCVVDRDGFRHLAHVEGWRMNYEALANRVIELARLNRATVYVESNGAGALIADAIGRKVPCKPLATTKQAKESRVEVLSAELASGRWIFRQPLGSPGAELRKLLSDMHTFSFDRHCGDRLAALLMAVEGIRAIESRPRGGSYRTYTLPNGGLGFARD